MTDPAHGGDIYREARLSGGRAEDFLDFSANINPLGYPPAVDQALADARPLIRHYPEPYSRSLTEDLAAFLGLAPEEVLVGNGSTELIYLLARALPVSRGVIAAPAFSEYERALSSAGVFVEHALTRPEDGFIPVQAPPARSGDLVFIGNPGNPGGGLAPAERLTPIIEALMRAGAYVALDEAFIDFAPEASLTQAAPGFPRLIVLRSFTKFFGLPGLRLGYLTADKALVAALAGHKEPWSVGVLAQAAGRACLQDTDFMDRTRRTVRRLRGELADGLKAIPNLTVFPSRANYLLIRIDRPGLTAAELRKRLLSRRIIIRNADNFHGLNQRYFRVAVRPPDENQRLLEALQAEL